MHVPGGFGRSGSLPPMTDDLSTLLLQLRLRAFAPTDVLAEAAQLEASAVTTVLDVAQADGLVERRNGRIVGWTLTTAGRRTGQELLSAELDASGARGAVTDAYLDFQALNAELLSICTDWQTVVVGGDHVPNDHADARRDAAVLARLDVLHPAALQIAGALAAAQDRFGTYGPRLTAAHENVAAGRPEWLTRATGASYHGTWFELHEHLLVVLGIDRVAEAIPAYTPTIVQGDDTEASGHAMNGGPRTGDAP